MKNKLTYIFLIIYIYFYWILSVMNVIYILLIIYNFKIINYLFMTSLVQVWSNQRTKNHYLSNILIDPVFNNMVQITEIMTSTRSVHSTRKPRSSGLGVTIVMPLTQVVPPTLLFYIILIKKKELPLLLKHIT